MYKDEIINFLRIIKNHIKTTLKTRGNYKSFSDALLKCKSYEDKYLINIIIQKTQYYSRIINSEVFENPNNDFVLLLKCIENYLNAKGEIINIIDFGGGAGKHYYDVKKYFSNNNALINWNIIETEAMCKENKPYENNEMRFFPTIKESMCNNQNIHLVYSNSAVQYIEYPYDTLQNLVNMNANEIIISRIPITKGEEIIAKQYSKYKINGPYAKDVKLKRGYAEYPITILNRAKIEEIMKRKYNLKLIFNEKNKYICNWHTYDVFSWYGILK